MKREPSGTLPTPNVFCCMLPMAGCDCCVWAMMPKIKFIKSILNAAARNPLALMLSGPECMPLILVVIVAATTLNVAPQVFTQDTATGGT